MAISRLLFALLLVSPVACARTALSPMQGSQDSKPRASVSGTARDVATVEWMRHNASAIRTIDPADDNYGDLAPVGKAIGNSRIVMLGDPSHGMGSTFSAQTRLVKYLHQKLGFDVLVFEAGLYDMSKVWDAFQADAPSAVAFRSGVARVWTAPDEMRSLVSYVAENSHSARPLELAGYDAQFTGPPSYERLTPDLQAYLRSAGLQEIFASDTMLWRGIRRSHWLFTRDATTKKDSLPPDSTDLRSFLPRLQILRDSIAARSHAQSARFWLQVLASVDAYSRQVVLRTADKEKYPWIGWNVRDEQGAKNLLWLANDRYKGHKIIVWSATIHASRNLNTIETRDSTLTYSSIVPMGQHAWAALGRQMYTLGIVALTGSARIGTQVWTTKADQQPEVELEELFGLAGFDLAYLDYRSKRSTAPWLNEPFVSRPLGNQAMMGRWPDMLDGILFVRTGTPATWPTPPKK